MVTPPDTEARNSEYELHGDTIEDPYLWLEDESDARSEWIDAQNEHVDEDLSDLAVREQLRPAFETFSRTTDFGPITAAPTGYFQEIEREEDDQPILYYRETLSNERKPLVDPNEFSTDGTAAIGWWSVSPDGDRLAYGVHEGGNEQYDVRILDVHTGTVRDVIDDVGRTGSGTFAWTKQGVYYQGTGDVGDGGQLEKALYFHEFGTDAAEDVIVYEVDEPSATPIVRTDREGEHVILAPVAGWERNDILYKHVDDTEFTRVITDAEHFYHPLVYGDTLFVRTDYEAQNYRIASLDLSGDVDEINPDELNAVVAERDQLLQSIEIAGDRILGHYEQTAVSQLEVFELDGEHVQTAPIPELGSIAQVRGNRDAPEAFFKYQSFAHPPTVFRYELGSNTLTEIDKVEVEIDVDLTVDRVWYESADGTEVPMFVVHRSDITLDGDNPALLYGYGGFGITMSPGFLKYESEFLRQGGVYAKANLRGGEAFGTEWHEAARHENKQNTFDDMVAAAEALIEDGYTNSDRLAIRGGSNGGLTVGAVLTQRPDLIRAVVCRVPLLDMLRFNQFLLGEAWTTEYGSPDDPDAYEWLREYSPYHNVERRDYPAVLFETAESDTRVHPVHAWKLTARLQELNTSDHPILCKTSRDTGHGMGKPTWMVVDEQLDRWSFIFRELDIEYDSE